MHRYGHRLSTRTALWAGVVLWAVWRVHAVLSLPSYADPRETLLFEDIARVHAGLPPVLFHWPGTPWTWLLAWATRLTNSTLEPDMLVVSRLLTIPFGIASLLSAYGLASRVLRGPLVPIALLAVAPGFASGEANLALVDVPALTLSLVALNIAFRAVPAEGISRYVLGAAAGAAVGLGAAFKLPAAAALPVVAVLVAPSPGGVRARVVALALLAAGATCGFVAGCPYILRDALGPGAGPVLAGLAYEMRHYNRGHFGVFATAGSPVAAYTASHAAAAVWCLGPGGLATLVPLVAWAAYKTLTRRTFWLWVWATCCIGAILLHRFSFPRHWLMAGPPIFMLASMGLEALTARWAVGARIAVAAALCSGAAVCVGLNARESGPSTFEAADAWLSDIGARYGVSAVGVGADPRLSWLYPRSAHGGPGRVNHADLRVVARLEADIQIAAEMRPDTFRDDDFFPLTRAHYQDGAAHLALRDARQYAEVARFAPDDPAWARRGAFLGLRPPFPLDALLHPDIRVYATPDTAARLATSD
ncbi:hypothetical protein HN371_22260 [Candidatus Poribacteria bacterium]|jgi:hypothetical protein|nr:hypothetical protein [Candidatus Poribacteria bacterium]MBT5533178.1 hypothetical protein [Candidatus Poribacteria bacterium]MBT5711581.1 hypothetical protein [Candidatus Poribacteria bacterium]MBT7807313.1 hypothetical protein [Candidatus Poribacteria bacterium]